MKKSNITKIQKLQKVLEDAQSVLDAILEEEQDSFDSKSEAWQESDRGMEAEEALDSLGSACDSLSEVTEYLSEVA